MIEASGTASSKKLRPAGTRRTRAQTDEGQAKSTDGSLSAAARGLEQDHEVEADPHQDGRRDRPRPRQRQIEHVQGEEVARKHAQSGGRARGDGEAGHVAQETRRAEPPAARRNRKEEARNPDRQGSRQCQLSRQQGVGDGGQPDREDQEGGERGLGYEELCHPLQVAQNLASLLDHRGHCSEVAPHQDEIRNAARHLRAGPLRDRQASRLECRDVVDAVADHRHVAPGIAQGFDDTPFPRRGDPPDHVALGYEAAERGGIGGKIRSAEGPRDLDARVSRDRRHGLRSVAREYFQLYSLRPKERNGLARVGAKPLCEDHKPKGLQARGQLLSVHEIGICS